MGWETVIGLEIHVQLKTKSKIFSGSSTTFGSEPNTQASLIDLGMPGTLPVLNADTLNMAIRFGLGINARIANKSIFARKNYFYPDLPKGYQISQFDLPIVGEGQINIILDDDTQKTIRVTRAHLEEDAGKSLHEDFHGMTGIDLNRAGTPLLEIVSEPDMRSAKEAVAYMREMHALIQHLDISDGNMAEGSMRCDANVSIRKKGEDTLGTRAEIKNLNSFRFIERAINFEVERQIDLIENGRSVIQETRLYDPDKDETRPMRSKEEANDYRYFPDPDLLPVIITKGDIDAVRKELPELPQEKRDRFVTDYGLKEHDAQLLTCEKSTATYFEAVLRESNCTPKLAANWVMGELMGNLNKMSMDITQCPVAPEQLGTLIQRIEDKTISGRIAKTVFEAMWQGEGSVDTIIASRGLKQVTDSSEIESIVDEVMAQNEAQVTQYRSSDDIKRKKLIGFFVGQVMKASKGKANPQEVNKILGKKLQ